MCKAVIVAEYYQSPHGFLRAIKLHKCHATRPSIGMHDKVNTIRPHSISSKEPAANTTITLCIHNKKGMGASWCYLPTSTGIVVTTVGCSTWQSSSYLMTSSAVALKGSPFILTMPSPPKRNARAACISLRGTCMTSQVWRNINCCASACEKAIERQGLAATYTNLNQADIAMAKFWGKDLTIFGSDGTLCLSSTVKVNKCL